ncbi:N-acetyl-6-hydroxytryptophan oxidase ivoB [Penicillium canariense]|uniref:N-acetyl-6-hydroxytryptophan oxidase ivoB n=1 Tax=Penicillium canariense TaxID=189055 RepID=A0A9W9LNB7_9EURO|nr:N-acetyl-6-hydroxytryptophan oxidase ivoB [Penicillium canariense]KAJ5167769.1 N-acetyl-6-hydroxytryptophan oxidase ivoB [Penicillium canariense]
MLPAKRISYTNAVLCMTRTPPRLPTTAYPGVRSRFDDFVACGSPTCEAGSDDADAGLHRRFLWLFESALWDECRYTGYLPYWNWPLWAGKLHDSPLFDCSETSLSGDGDYNPGEQSVSGGDVTLPRGTGGDCTRCGPFKDMVVHLGPFSRMLPSLTEIPSPGFEYNPRCLNRSLNNFVAAHFTNVTQVSHLMAAADIADFQMVMDHWPAEPTGVLGLHGGGHFSIGSTLQDLFSSPQDPAFMLHHAMIDRM